VKLHKDQNVNSYQTVIKVNHIFMHLYYDLITNIQLPKPNYHLSYIFNDKRRKCDRTIENYWNTKKKTSKSSTLSNLV